VATDRGRLIFLDRQAWTRLWLQSHRVRQTADGRLSVELEIRARGRERSARLRLIFYDRDGTPVAVTPVIPYRFLPHYGKEVVITSASPRASSYIGLVEYD
jgi:hypothetical protein